MQPERQVSFFVRKSGPHQTRRGPIVYEEVVNAEGGIWNRVGNTFIVPVTGLYVVHMSIKEEGNTWISATIVKDLTDVQELVSGGGSSAAVSTAVLIEMNAGEQISGKLTNGRLRGGTRLNHLSGFLAYA